MGSTPTVREQPTILDERVFAGKSYQFYRLEDIDLDIFCDSEEMMPYWADVWPSGLVLAETLAQMDNLENKRVLELGCGIGFPSMVAASRGAQVVATDFIPEALDLLQENARLNDIQLETTLFDWLHPIEIGRFDIVVASDVLYDKWHIDALLSVISLTLDAGGHAHVADPERVTARGFLDAATFAGFSTVKRPIRGVSAVPPKSLAGDAAWTQPMSMYDIEWREYRTRTNTSSS
jgi:predicted nicotinamide N-methyase